MSSGLFSINSFLNVKALVGTFNQKALVGAFSVIVKTLPMVRLQLYSCHSDRRFNRTAALRW